MKRPGRRLRRCPGFAPEERAIVQFNIPEIKFTQYRLDNGLEIILCPDRRIPLVHLSIYYDVGSSHETIGYSGLAHLFEHLMFQGSENLGPNEHGRLVDMSGGEWNASTSKDRTHYYETVPSNYLDLVLWLESDRMRSLNISAENFENQRMTVIEEKKESYDNRPYGPAHLRFDELSYGNWAYAHPIIGVEEDLRNCTLEDVESFHRKFYGPGNAVLVLAGDFEPENGLRRIRHYFEKIENHTSPLSPDLAWPDNSEAKRERLADQLAALPALTLGYPMGAMHSDEYYDLTLLSIILVDGDASRFYRKYVHENNWVAQLYAGPDQQVGPQVFRVWALLQGNPAPEIVLAEMEDDLAAIGQEGVSPQELEMALNQLIYRQVSMMSTVSSVGELLGFFQSCLGDADLINKHLARYLEVTPERIRRSAAKVFHERHVTSMIIDPLPGEMPKETE